MRTRAREGDEAISRVGAVAKRAEAGWGEIDAIAWSVRPHEGWLGVDGCRIVWEFWGAAMAAMEFASATAVE